MVLTYLDYGNRMMSPTIRKNKVGGQEGAATSLQQLTVGDGLKALKPQWPGFLDRTAQMIPFSFLFFKKDDKASVTVSILICSIRHGQSTMAEATTAAPPKNKELVDKLIVHATHK